jgi:ribonucleoside-triphosphate reductase
MRRCLRWIRRIQVERNNKIDFISKYKGASNTANATVDDNSNVGNRNIAVINAEIHKPDNIEISRGMIMHKLKELYPDFDNKQYIRDLESHIIYKHDESSFSGAIAPYCCSISMYPFLTSGIEGIGGLSAAPKNIDSFCGMYVNLIFATASQFAGAVATSEFLLYFTYFAKKEWGEEFWKHPETKISISSTRKKTILSQIHQYWQQVIYSINQPAAARGMQSAFINFSYFDKPFFEGMFGNFYFPDGTQPDWDSLNWIQKEFMQWFNQERLRCLITFPVESFALVYKDGHFLDQESADFVAEEYARGHSFFTYISDSVDSLSSCCRLKNKVQTKEFNFTNGNMGVETGSKSVITLNLNRIIQNSYNRFLELVDDADDWKEEYLDDPTLMMCDLQNILERVYKYHTAYNELLWDMYDANLLPVYKSGFIDLNKQYLTIGLNGLNQAAEFLGIKCSDNKQYERFCQTIFGTIKECNESHKGKFNGHQLTFNTECVPAESLAIKNYNWDKADNYWVPSDTNLYASYIYKPNDSTTSVLEKLRMHGSRFIGDYLDGGSAAHINLSEHLSKKQYQTILNYAAQEGCQYFTFNIPNCECDDCGYIAKQPFTVCPKCGSTHVSLWDRIIGYLTKIKNWSEGRQIEQQTRIYSNECDVS